MSSPTEPHQEAQFQTPDIPLTHDAGETGYSAGVPEDDVANHGLIANRLARRLDAKHERLETAEATFGAYLGVGEINTRKTGWQRTRRRLSATAQRLTGRISSQEYQDSLDETAGHIVSSTPEAVEVAEKKVRRTRRALGVVATNHPSLAALHEDEPGHNTTPIPERATQPTRTGMNESIRSRFTFSTIAAENRERFIKEAEIQRAERAAERASRLAARQRGGQGEDTLPGTLPDFKYIDVDALKDVEPELRDLFKDGSVESISRRIFEAINTNKDNGMGHDEARDDAQETVLSDVLGDNASDETRDKLLLAQLYAGDRLKKPSRTPRKRN